MAASRDVTLVRAAIAVGVVVVVVFCWPLPLFHIVRLNTPTATAATSEAAGGVFDAATVAAKIWKIDLPAATAQAVELTPLLGALRENFETARSKYAKSAGLGTAYYFVRGHGKVVARERNYLRVALDDAATQIVALRIGAIFGNTVRDGCGLLDVNAFPGLQEFNDLSAQLNGLVETTVLPVLREKAAVGSMVEFAGCAEAPESAADAGEPQLNIVPVKAEVR